GFGWVSELIGIAGGDNIFSELAREPGAGQRIIADETEVFVRAPASEIGGGSALTFEADIVRARAGWSAVPAVQHDQLFEVKSPLILQPGPAALSDGLAALRAIIRQWVAAHTSSKWRCARQRPVSCDRQRSSRSKWRSVRF